MVEVTHLPLHPTRRFMLQRSLPHLIAGGMLVLTGVDALSLHGSHGGSRRILAWLAIAAGATLLGATIRELRGRGTGHDRRVAWVELFAGVLLLVEASELWRPGKLWQPAAGYVLAAALTLAMGLRLVRPGGRRLQLDARGIRVRFSPLRRFELAWGDVRSIAAVPGGLEFVTRSGHRTRLGLGSVENREQVEHAIRAAFALRTQGQLPADAPHAGVPGHPSTPSEPQPSS